MEQVEKPESNSPMPVIPRLDRLDRLLQLLEEKHSLSRRHSSSPVVRNMEPDDEEEEEDYQCKTLSSALEEIHHKGTLIDRVATLENRVLQLSLEMDEGNTSRSSSSTVQISEKSRHGSCLSSLTKQQDEDETCTLQGMQDQPLIQEEVSAQLYVATEPQGSQIRTRQKRKAHRKWLGLFRIRCLRHQ